MKKPKAESRTTYILLVSGEFHGAYAAKRAMFIDAKEVLFGHAEKINRDWNGETPYVSDNIQVHKSVNLTTPWSKYYNWVDQLPTEIGEEILICKKA